MARMSQSVKLDGQFCFCTEEIDNASCDWMLPAELQPGRLSILEP
jgi:hypothetical protein